MLSAKRRRLHFYWLMSRAVILATASICLSTPSRCAEQKPTMADVVQPYIDQHQIAGAVSIVANKDGIMDAEAFGYADISRNKPMKPDSLFWIASMSKPITATSVMMLVDDGKIGLDDPVSKYIPEFQPQMESVSQSDHRVHLGSPTRRITVRHVLSHMSGLYFNSAVERPVLDAYPLAVRVESYGKSLLQFEPGTDFSYSNAGINTAGRIVELVSGMPFEDFLKRRLFDPLGMKDTTFKPTSEQIGRLASSYTPSSSKEGELDEIPLSKLHYPSYQISRQFPIPAGGLFSTASDMSLFCRMFLNRGVLNGKRLLSESAIREMSRNQLPGGVAQRNALPYGYGLGWFAEAGNTIGHAGAYATDMHVNLERGLATVWMVQIVGGPGAQSGEAFHKAAMSRF
jgi:CubicO group peptidase (beta-lactamase class C family)